MKLSELQRDFLNKLIEGHAILSVLRSHFSHHSVTALLTFSERGFEVDDKAKQYWLILNKVTTIVIRPGLGVTIPSELANIQSPSMELMDLLIRLFRGQRIFEWECFVSEEDSKQVQFEPAFRLTFDKTTSDATQWVRFFSDSSITHWQIWIEYGDLEIAHSLGDTMNIDLFIDEVESFLNTRLV